MIKSIFTPHSIFHSSIFKVNNRATVTHQYSIVIHAGQAGWLWYSVYSTRTRVSDVIHHHVSISVYLYILSSITNNYLLKKNKKKIVRFWVEKQLL